MRLILCLTVFSSQRSVLLSIICWELEMYNILNSTWPIVRSSDRIYQLYWLCAHFPYRQNSFSIVHSLTGNRPKREIQFVMDFRVSIWPAPQYLHWRWYIVWRASFCLSRCHLIPSGSSVIIWGCYIDMDFLEMHFFPCVNFKMGLRQNDLNFCSAINFLMARIFFSFVRICFTDEANGRRMGFLGKVSI